MTKTIRRKSGVGCLTGILLILVCTATIQADVRIRKFFQSDGLEIMGQTIPASADTNTIWLTEKNARMDAGDTASIIVLGDEGTLIQLDHRNKKYTEINLKDAWESLDPQMKQQMEQMAPMMKLEVSVQKTDETRKIGDWNCTKYIITKNMGMMKSTTEAWVTNELNVNADTYFRALNSTLVFMPGYDKAIEEFKKLKGVTVRDNTTAEVMGKKIGSSSELIDYTEQDAPPDAFKIPNGYKEIKAQLPGMK